MMREKKEHAVDSAVAARIAAVRRVSNRSRPRWLTAGLALLAVALVVLLTWCGAARDENGAVELPARPAPVEIAPAER
jgi:hypothetical protein